MKKLLMGLIGLTLLASCSNSDEFVLDGQVKNAGDLKKVMLYEGEKVIDSAFLNENDKFRFRRTALEAKPYTLMVANRPYMLVLQNGDKVQFETDLNQNEDEYSIEGSEISQKLQKLSGIKAAFQRTQNELQKEFEVRLQKGDDESDVQSELMVRHQRALEETSRQTYQFAKDNEDNLGGFYGMMSLFALDPITYEQELIAYADRARVKFPNNSAVQFFANHMAELKPLSIGQKAPDFESLSPTGQTVKLSDFRGKYVLLDFWASWCAPCREENPNIVAQYHAFKDKGFTVLGVSLDDNPTAWMKAVKDDKLEWTQVSELKRWDSEAGLLYKITAIPASFLIDPDGIIVGKNLRGAALEESLTKLLP
jgi:peroxiredoxin